MTDIEDPRLKNLIMNTTAQMLRDTGLDKTPFEDLTPEQIDMLCNRMGFEIKAKLTEFFAGVEAEEMKEHLKVVDEATEDVKRRFNQERKGSRGS